MFTRENIDNLRYKWIASLFLFYERTAWSIKYRATPKILWLLKILIVGSFIGGACVLTIKGFEQPLSDSYKELFSVILGTTGTIVAIFFSLVLIPLNPIASRYSPRFLEHLKNDHVFIATFIYSFVSVGYNALLLVCGGNQLLALCSVAQLLFLFIILYWLWRRAIFLTNPMNSVLLPEQMKTVRTMKREIRKTTNRSIRSIRAISGAARTESQRLGYAKVDDSVIEYLKTQLLPFREIAMKAIKNGELEQSKNAIGSMTAIVLNYLIARKNYYNDDDPLMYFIYTEFKLLVESSDTKELKIRLHPFIVDAWRNIGVKAAATNIKGLPRWNNNINSLVTYPIKGLQQLFATNLQEGDATTPGDVCRALGDIGAVLMQNGYDHQAADSINELAAMSKLADVTGVGVFSGSANYALMRTYINGLGYRNEASRDITDYSFSQIHSSISELLAVLLTRQRSTFDQMVLGPFIGWLTDPINGINLARATEYALFSDDLNEESVILNMKSVENNINHVVKAIGLLEQQDDSFFIGQAYENLYQIMMVLLSYLSDDIANDHVMYYNQEPVKTPELLQEAQRLLEKCIDVMIAKAKANAPASHMPNRGYNDILTTMYLIILYEAKKNSRTELNPLFLSFHSKMKTLLDDHTSNGTTNSNSELTKHFRLVRAVLKHNRYYRRASELNVPDYQYGGGDSFMYDSELPQPMIGRVWSPTRLTFQKNGHYISAVEDVLGISQAE